MKHKTRKTRQKTDDGKPNETAQLFAGGGTVTGRFSGSSPSFDYGYVGPRRFTHDHPNPQRLDREGAGPISVMVTMDFTEIEKRVLAQLDAKGDIAEAMRKALVSKTKDRHKI